MRISRVISLTITTAYMSSLRGQFYSQLYIYLDSSFVCTSWGHNVAHWELINCAGNPKFHFNHTQLFGLWQTCYKFWPEKMKKILNMCKTLYMYSWYESCPLIIILYSVKSGLWNFYRRVYWQVAEQLIQAPWATANQLLKTACFESESQHPPVRCQEPWTWFYM